MKIKLQQGGIVYTPFFRDSVNQQVQTSTSASSDKGDKEDQLIQKEIINVLKENGLPNDVDYFLNKANGFLAKSRNLGLFDTGQSNYDMSDLIRLQSLANRLKHNSELHKSAAQQIIKEGSGSEVAVSNTGDLYIYDGDEIKTISAKTYHSNPSDYRVLTNSELIHLREENPELSYNDSILTDLANTVGMKSIVDYVKATISAFGTNKNSNTFDRYTVKNKGKIEQGFEQLLGLEGPDGVYKGSFTSKVEDQGYDSEESLQLAVNYLYKTLPANMKHVLKANAAAEGYNPNDPKAVQQLLTMAIYEHTDHSRETKQEVSFDSSATSALGGGKSGSGKDVEQTRAEMIATMQPMQETTLWGSQDTSALVAPSSNLGKPTDNKKEQIGQSTIRDLFQKDAVGQFVAMESVSFGGQPLKENEIGRVVYDGVSDMHKAFLPVNNRVLEATGQIVPDYNAAERLTKFKKWLDEGYGISQNSIIAKMRELDLDVYYDQQSNDWRFRNQKEFILLNGYASSDFVNFDTDSQYVENLNSSDGKQLFRTYTRMVNYGTDTPTKSASKRDDVGYQWLTFGENRGMYKSIIAVPITNTYVSTLTTNNQLVSSDLYHDVYRRDQAMQQARQIQTNF